VGGPRQLLDQMRLGMEGGGIIASRYECIGEMVPRRFVKLDEGLGASVTLSYRLLLNGSGKIRKIAQMRSRVFPYLCRENT
jgi:hypothetical protein